jgi:hypothetical protein
MARRYKAPVTLCAFLPIDSRKTGALQIKMLARTCNAIDILERRSAFDPLWTWATLIAVR